MSNEDFDMSLMCRIFGHKLFLSDFVLSRGSEPGVLVCTQIWQCERCDEVRIKQQTNKDIGTVDCRGGKYEQ